ncbi:MAG: hypothetical protein NVS9B1_04730 [Candidatus Dormibacteraceae bacterium]
MIAPNHWWLFSRAGFGRRHLNPLGIAWTLAAYLLLGFGTGYLARFLHHAGFDGAAILLFGLAGGWTLLRVGMDGEWLRLSAWFTGAGWLVVSGLLSAHQRCGSVVYGGDVAAAVVVPCRAYQDFTGGAFLAAWLLLGATAALLLAGWGFYRWFRRDPLHAYRALL